MLWGLAAIAILVMGVGAAKWQTHVRWTTLAKYIDRGDIKMYSYEGCQPASAAREHFEKYKIAYSECDVQKDAQCNREFQALRTEGVPTFLIYGKDVQQGFRKDALYKALIRKRQD